VAAAVGYPIRCRGIQAIDSSSLAPSPFQLKLRERVEDTVESIKSTFLIVCAHRAVLNVHYSISPPQDTQITQKILSRYVNKLKIGVAIKGFDWDGIRQTLRAGGDQINNYSSRVLLLSCRS
jgi:hypothetical protein